MRVGVDSSVCAFNKAGNARYAQSLVAALRSVSHEIDIELIALTLPQAIHATAAGLRRKALVAFWEFCYAPRLLGLLARHARVELLHLTMPMPVGPGAPKTVITVLDLTPVLFPEWFTPVMGLRLRRWLKVALRQADGVITISQHTANDLWRVAPELSVPIWPVLLGSFLERERGPAPLSSGVSAPGYLLSVGTLEPRKNLGFVLRGYAELVHKLPSAPPLVIVGGAGWKAENLERLAEELGVAKRVVRLGYVSDTELYALYSHAAALLYPSRYEGFGFPLLEAMGCGCPVVTSSSSSLPEVVGGAGLLVDPERPDELARAMALLLTQPALAAQMRQLGRDRARQFSWERCARETGSVYHEVAARGSAYQYTQ